MEEIHRSAPFLTFKFLNRMTKINLGLTSDQEEYVADMMQLIITVCNAYRNRLHETDAIHIVSENYVKVWAVPRWNSGLICIPKPVFLIRWVLSSSSTLHGRSSMPCNPHMKRTMRLFSIRTDTVTAMMRLTTPHSYSRILFQI